MDKNSSNYVLIFVTAMTVVVALGLTAFRQATMETAKQNEAIFNKRAILSAVNQHLGMGDDVKADDLTDQQVLDIFNNKVQQFVYDTDGEPVDGIMAENVEMEKEKKKPVEDRKLPLFVYENEGKQFYILSVRGSGLWDEIWGNIALENDLTTIAGASFDHKGETPGLGAEIKDNPGFSRDFIGTKIFRDGKFVSVKVRKGGAQDETYEVDGISGATVTADGVNDMLYNGISLYLPVINEMRSRDKVGMAH